MLRIIFSLLLAIALALTSQSMAVARGANAPAGQMVLCTGLGTVAIYVDAEGRPTSAPHICPDAALHVLEVPATPDVAAPLKLVRFDPIVLRHAAIAPRAPRALPPSRGPPLNG